MTTKKISKFLLTFKAVRNVYWKKSHALQYDTNSIDGIKTSNNKINVHKYVSPWFKINGKMNRFRNSWQ